MKKRVLSMILALALCMGLTVPAFAAETDDILADINKTGFWIDVQDADSLRKEISVKLWPWDINDAGSITWTKASKTFDMTVEVIELPLGVTLTAGPNNEWVSGVFAYSDPDGDGVYDERLQVTTKDGKSDVVAVTEAGPFRNSGSTSYTSAFAWRYGYNSLMYAKAKGYRIMTTDYLVDTFGPNTLIDFCDANGKSRRYILLTGEERSDDLAYDKLEDKGLYFTKYGDLVSGWAVEPVNQALEANLSLLDYTVEEAHNFDLHGKITRGEFASIAILLYVNMRNELADRPGENPFEDVPEDHPYRNHIVSAYELGIVTGKTGTTFDPDALVTREQAAAMLSRVYTALGGEIPEVDATTFSDDASISAYARDAVAFMTKHGIIGGMGNNTFAPRGDATVEQAVKIAVEMLNNLKVK